MICVFENLDCTDKGQRLKRKPSFNMKLLHYTTYNHKHLGTSERLSSSKYVTASKYYKLYLATQCARLNKQGEEYRIGIPQRTSIKNMLEMQQCACVNAYVSAQRHRKMFVRKYFHIYGRCTYDFIDLYSFLRYLPPFLTLAYK